MRDETGVQEYTMKTVEICGADSRRQLELARIFRALADPVRLRMLSLMFYSAFRPEQMAQALGVELTIVRKHLVYFRDSKLVVVRTKRKVRYYGIRKEADRESTRLVNLVIELLEPDAAIRGDLAIIKSLCKESPSAAVRDELPQPETQPTCTLSRPVPSAARTRPGSIWAGTGRG